MSGSGEDEFRFSNDRIPVRNAMAFLGGLEDFLKENDAVVDESQVAMPTMVSEQMSPEDIAVALFEQYDRMKRSAESVQDPEMSGVEGSIKAQVNENLYFQQLLIRARQLAVED